MATIDNPINLLLVEDDIVDIQTFRRSMRQFRLANPLYIARDGFEALNMLRSKQADNTLVVPHPRIVLLDLDLPRMDGLTFLNEVQDDSLLRTLPIIIITGSTDERSRATALGLNVASYFFKPVDFDALVEMISCLGRLWFKEGKRLMREILEA